MLAFAFASAALILLVEAMLHQQRVEARRLIAETEDLVQNVSPGGLNTFLGSGGHFIRRTQQCDKDGCFYIADCRNNWISWLPIVPPSELYVSITQRQSRLAEVYLSVKTAISARPYAVTIRTVSTDECKLENCKDSSWHTVKDSSGNILHSSVELGSTADDAQRKLAFHVDVDCMFEVRGCANASEITGSWSRYAKD